MNITKHLFAIVGSGLLIGSFYSYKNTSQFIEKSIETQGVVELLESHSSSSSDNSIMYKPLVRFIDTKGIKIEFLSTTSSNPPSYSINEK